MLLIIPGPAARAGQAHFLDERLRVGDGAGGVSGQLGAADALAKLRIGQTAQQRLAACRAQRGRTAADLRIHADGVDGLDLVDINDLQPVQHGKVHRLLGQLQQSAQVRLSLGLELHLIEVQAAQFHDLHAQAVGTAAALFHVAALAKGGQKPVYRGLMQPHARRDLRYAQTFFFAGQRLDDGQCAVNGLHRCFFHGSSSSPADCFASQNHSSPITSIS